MGVNVSSPRQLKLTKASLSNPGRLPQTHQTWEMASESPRRPEREPRGIHTHKGWKWRQQEPFSVSYQMHGKPGRQILLNLTIEIFFL